MQKSCITIIEILLKKNRVELVPIFDENKR